MPSLKPITPLEQARSYVDWLQDAEHWMATLERNAQHSHFGVTDIANCDAVLELIEDMKLKITTIKEQFNG